MTRSLQLRFLASEFRRFLLLVGREFRFFSPQFILFHNEIIFFPFESQNDVILLIPLAFMNLHLNSNIKNKPKIKGS